MRKADMAAKPPKSKDAEELVTLWHVAGARPCRGPALKVPPEFLEAGEPALPQGCELPDGSKIHAGDPLVCGTCGERLASDLASQLALSRERYRA
jgi:hypothetical protein